MSAQGIRHQKIHSGQPGSWTDGRSGYETTKESSLSSVALMNHFLTGVERRAFLTARMATQDVDEALDIVQDSMLKLVQNYSNHAEAEWGPLFQSILHSKINDWYRRRQVRNRWRVFFSSTDEEGDEATGPEDWVAQSSFPEPDQQLGSDLLGEKLIALIEQLPLRQQQALILRAWEGYNITQTAEIMQCSEGSVKTHYSRAVHALREKLGDY